MKKVAILVSLIVSSTFTLMGQRTSAENFKEFFVPGDYDVTGNGIKSSFTPYWGGWPYDWSILCKGNCGSRYIPYTSSDEKRWFIAAGGQLGPSYTEDFLPNVINPQTGWTYLINNDFEIRFTNQAQAYPIDWSEDAYIFSSPLGDGGKKLIKVPFQIWNTTKNVRLIPFINDEDGSGDFGLIAKDHKQSSLDNDPYTDMIYWFLPKDSTDRQGSAGYDDWLLAAQSDISKASDVGPAVLDNIVFVQWNAGIENASDWGKIDFGLIKIITGTLEPDTFSWVTPNVIDTVNLKVSSDSLLLDWTQSRMAYGDSANYYLYMDGKLFKNIISTTDTSYTVTVEDFINNWPVQFQMLPRKIFTFDLWVHYDTDSVKVTGEPRKVFVNRYEYLSTEGEGVPVEFALHENYPNPFNPTTTLRFDLPKVSDITLTIYNMLGQKVRTFNMQSTPAGYHSVTWDATNDLNQQVGAGVYLYQLQAKGFVKTRKMVLLK